MCHERFVDGAIDALFTGAAGMELVVARGTDLSARKRALACDADCIVALPGGPGTWDELWEAAALRQIGFESAAPVCVVNVDGYYDGFGTMLARAHADGILHKPPSEFLFFARDAAERSPGAARPRGGPFPHQSLVSGADSLGCGLSGADSPSVSLSARSSRCERHGPHRAVDDISSTKRAFLPPAVWLIHARFLDARNPTNRPAPVCTRDAAQQG